MIHGGVIGLILDEVTGRAALWRARAFVVTLGIRIRYAAIMQPGLSYIARAEVEADADEQIRVSGSIEEMHGGGLVATAVSTFAVLRGQRLADALASLPEATRALALELGSIGQHTP
jgi:acyl-coenzyme A thioesterase PaaI-like protein